LTLDTNNTNEAGDSSLAPATTTSPAGEMPTRRERRSSTLASALLAASAFVLAGLTILQAGRATSTAFAAESANSGQLGYSIATIRSGMGPDGRPHDMLYIIDSRGELLYIYFIENVAQQRVWLREVVSLPQLFRVARGG